MNLSPELLQILLHRGEGDTLDFKEQQQLETDPQKAEFIKDVLAFANGWRSEVAYILVGVKEVPGESRIVGIQNHHDDADLQQIVNGKTNAPIPFHYFEQKVGSETIGVIQIPAAGPKRPFYLKKDYFGLLREKVYVRRGSTTAVASLEEVRDMGASLLPVGPSLVVSLGDPVGRAKTEGPYLVTSTIRKELPKTPVKLPETVGGLDKSFLRGTGLASYRFNSDKAPKQLLPMPIALNLGPTREEVVAWAQEVSLLSEVALHFENKGGQLAEGLSLELQMKGRADEVLVLERPPTRPQGRLGREMYFDPRRLPLVGQASGLSVEDKDIDVWISKLRPGEHWWSPSFWVGASSPCTVEFVGRLIGDSLATPVNVELKLEIRTREAYLTESILNKEEEDG